MSAHSPFASVAASVGMLAGLILLIAPLSAEARLRVWVTDDPSVAQDEPTDDPDDEWVETDASDEVAVNLLAGDDLYIAVLNDEDQFRVKYWVVRLEGPLSQAFSFAGPGTSAFDGFQTADDSTPVPVKGLQSVNIAPVRQWTFRFSPQPRWERLALEAFPQAVGQLKITSNSVCSNLNVGPEQIVFDDTSLDAPSGVSGSPLFTEFWVFPRSVPADLAVLPSFVAPLPSGEWSSEFVSTDPEGLTRPLGVKFSTAGPGLTPLDQFDAGFSMLGGADGTYDVFFLDSVSGSYANITLGTSAPPVPIAPPWAVAALALALALAAAALLAARRRRSPARG